jgi:hypothetical protein
MTVERRKDGSITIRNSKGTAVIGRFTGVADSKREEKYRKWVEECTKLVDACPHTIKETEEYFLGLCDTLPIEINDMSMKNFQLNVVMNHYRDKLEHQAPVLSFDMTDEEIEKWHKEDDAMREEAMNSSPEGFGLRMHGYCLQHTERNKVFYEEAYIDAQKRMKHPNQIQNQIQMHDICFYFEETTGHIQSSGGGESLIRQLVVFRGVSQEDIEKCSPRFLGYISTLREMGKLPDFMGDQ